MLTFSFIWKFKKVKCKIINFPLNAPSFFIQFLSFEAILYHNKNFQENENFNFVYFSVVNVLLCNIS